MRETKEKIEKSKIYTEIKFIVLCIFFIFMVLLVGIFLWQKYRIGNHLEKNENALTWEIVQDEEMEEYEQVAAQNKDSLLIIAKQCLEDGFDGNSENKKKYMYCLNAYYRNANDKKRHYVDEQMIRNRTCMDSIVKVKKKMLCNDDSLSTLSKVVNGGNTRFVSNKYLSGCPTNSNTIDYKLQYQLNKEIEHFIQRNNARNNIIATSIIIAQNDSGNIKVSASYPFLYNENIYHILQKEYELNKRIRAEDSIMGYNALERVRINTDGDISYINMCNSDMLPGSIVKPLLAYGVLNEGIYIEEHKLRIWLTMSLSEPTKDYFVKLYNPNNSINEERIKEINNNYIEDFGFTPYLGTISDFEGGDLFPLPIGQQHKVRFFNMVQAYMRIKTGKKVKLTYHKRDSLLLQDLSLAEYELNKLRSAMKALNGTAINVGQELHSNGVDTMNYISKTGTTEYNAEGNIRNRTSSLIIAMDKYTIGIQLYGSLIENVHDAKKLCIQLINNEYIRSYLK